MAMADYVIETRSKSGQYLGTLDFRDLQGEFRRSAIQEVRFTMSKASLDMFSYNEIYPAKTEILIRRNGVPVFLGPLWDLSISSAGEVKLMAQCLASYMEKRAILADTTYEDTLGNIAWQMIADSQARTGGDLGITRGTAVPSNGPSGKYKVKEGTILFEAHDEVSDGSNGFDWIFDTNRVYHQYYPRVTSTPANVRLEFGGNIQSYSEGIQGKYIGNFTKIIGKDGVISDPVVDTNSRDVYGLMDYIGEQTGLSDMNLLNAHNERILGRRRVPKAEITVVTNPELVNPFEGDINYGDIVPVIINDGYTQINQSLRGEGFQLFYNKSGKESFTLYLKELEDG